ncbi:MAG: hypothetical protein JXA30_13170 [Deltaproteobacteria bacterium]|nr:hypothetical protein [Deltaproteobacteria bacterium]
MFFAKDASAKTICLTLTFLLLLLCLLTSGCGRSHEKDPFEERGEAGTSQEDNRADAGLEPSQGATSGTREPTRRDGSTTPPYPDVVAFDATLSQDASSRDVLEEKPLTCEVNSDCRTSNKCELPVCTASGLCSYLPLEDGMPCYAAMENQICISGMCRTSFCGDGYLDTLSGEICEDGNTTTTDDCVLCRPATCGDGFLYEGEEECDPGLNSYCKEDCTLGRCGDGIITSPAENCEPSIDGSSCNDDCRISDSPEWQVLFETADPVFAPEIMPSTLLVDSSDNPVLISMDEYTDDNDNFRLITVVTKFDPNGEEIWQWKSDQEETPFGPSVSNNDSIIEIIPLSAAMDDTDNVLVAGLIYFMDLSEMVLPWLMKLTPEGTLAWSTTIDNDNDYYYSLCAVAVDDVGNIMTLMGEGEGGGASFPWNLYDPSIELFDSDGNHREEDAVPITGVFTTGRALSTGIIDGVSRFLLTGARYTPTGLATLLFLLDSDAEPVWNSPISYRDAAEDTGFIRALTTSNGDIVALGKTGSELYDFPYKYWFERYEPDKTARFDDHVEFRTHRSSEQFYLTTFLSGSCPMAVDKEDNVLFAYSLREIRDGGTYLIIDKYDSDGEPAWEEPMRYDTGPDDHYVPVEIVVGDQGTIYVLTWIWTDDQIVPALMRWQDRDYS